MEAKDKNNPVVRKKLVDANMQLVLRMAKLYKGRGVPMSILVEEGKKGLIEAIEKFDCDKNIKFIAYAVWFVRQNLIMAINNREIMQIRRNWDLARIIK